MNETKAVVVKQDALNSVLRVERGSDGYAERWVAQIRMPEGTVVTIPPRKWDAAKKAWCKRAKIDGQWKNVPLRDDEASPTGYIGSAGMLIGQAHAGLRISYPQAMMLNGQQVENPRVTLGPDGIPLSASCAVVVAGPGPFGHMIQSAVLVTIDVRTIWMQMLAKLAGEKREACCLSTADRQPSEDRPWVYYPMDSMVGYWIDLSHSDVVGLYADKLHILSTVERRVRTIAVRNALQTHPAFPGGKYATWNPEHGAWYMTVVGWKPGVAEHEALPEPDPTPQTATASDMEAEHDPEAPVATNEREETGVADMAAGRADADTDDAGYFGGEVPA